MPFAGAMLEITVVSLGMVVISQILQRKLVDKGAMKANQDKIKEKQRRLKELVGKEDSKSKGEAEKLQREMMELLGQSMQGTLKHMLVSFPIFILIFWLLGQAYGGTVIHLPLSLPVIHRNFSFEITRTVSWLWWYIYSSLGISVALSLGLKAIGR
jgi:uncharacterized membrane protein (DUF106 family)